MRILSLTRLVDNTRNSDKFRFETPPHSIATSGHGVCVKLFPTVHGTPAKRQQRQERETKMTIFTGHPHAQGVTYFEHWAFAIGIAWRLLRSVLAFSLHALLPFITIDRQLDLEATSAFLLERNDFIETAAAKGHASHYPVRAPDAPDHHDTPAFV